MVLTREQKAELNLTKHKGLMADLVLQSEDFSEQRFIAIISEATNTLLQLVELLEGVAALPNEMLYYRQQWADPEIFPATGFTAPGHKVLIESAGLSDKAKETIAQHEATRQAFEQAKRAVRDRVIEAWNEKLPELLPPASLLADVTQELRPFDPGLYDAEGNVIDPIAKLEKDVPEKELEDWFGAFYELARD